MNGNNPIYPNAKGRMKKLFRQSISLLLSLLLGQMNLLAQNAPPSVEKSHKIELIDGKKYYVHIVEKGQTIYSISKTYGSTVHIVLSNNPDAVDGIKPGDKLKIPVIGVAPKDAKVDLKPDKKNLVDTVTPRRATITGDIKSIAVPRIIKDTAVADTAIIPDLDIHVALFLPLELVNVDRMDVHKIAAGDEALNEELRISLEFYEGVKMAFDSLRKQNFNGRLHVYDTFLDSAGFAKLLKKPELKQMDLLIGPLYGRRFETVLKFAKENNIPIVSPTLQGNNILLGNPVVSKVTPSYVSQAEVLGQYIANKYSGCNILLFNSTSSKDKPYLNTFKKTANPILQKIKNDTVKEITFTTLKNFVSKTKPNIVVIPSVNQSFITEAVNKLFLMKQESKDSIIVFGMSNCLDIESLDFGYLNALHLNVAAYKFVDYSHPNTKNFILNYRNEFKTDPSEFVFLGFDAGYYYLKALQLYGKSMQNKLPKFKHKGIQHEFNFYQADPSSLLVPGSGYENKSIGIMKFENYSYTRIY